MGPGGQGGHTGAVPKVVKLVIIPALLLVVVGAVALLVREGGDGGGSPEALVVEQLIPASESEVIGQTEVGIDLIPGWDADLTVDGIPIPRDELERNLELGVITFDPGPGKALERLQGGQNCVTATYWQVATGPDQSFTRVWCFSAA